MNHHLVQYPPSVFLSSKYKSAGKDSTVILFIVAFAPVLIGIVICTMFGILSLTSGICSLLCLTIWGLAHDYFHDQFHITSPWKRFSFFLKWRDIHYVHHLDMSKNYGIISFQWDKLFKTYLEANITLDKGKETL
jgi:sterol desaturase/sphingolipid hydroxylase (fatty acid hydroxylase superfamily)